jgi:hypothetical protein
LARETQYIEKNLIPSALATRLGIMLYGQYVLEDKSILFKTKNFGA